MRGKRTFTCLAGFVLLATVNSGCAIRNLKEANQRLKESNDRLVSENNRLEHELAALERQLQSLDEPRARPVPSSAPSPATEEEFLPLPGEHQIVRSSEGVHVRFPDRVFFGLGQAKLTRQGQRVLDDLARVLKQNYPDRLIRVDGHTDDIPVRKVRHIYPSNWELSTARACTVVRYLVDRSKVSPDRIFPAGFAYHRPLETGKSSTARGKNRRVEITILNRRA